MAKALILFVGVGVISNGVYRYQVWHAVAQDIFLNLKFFMGIVTTYYLFRDFNIKKYKTRIRTHVKILILLYFALVIQNKITHIFPVADMRFGMNAGKNIFQSSNRIGFSNIFLTIDIDDLLYGFKKGFSLYCYGSSNSNLNA